MIVSVSKTGRVSVKTSPSNKLNDAIVRTLKGAVQDMNDAAFDQFIENVKGARKFAVVGGKTPEGFHGNIADEVDRWAYVLTNKTTCALAASKAMAE